MRTDIERKRRRRRDICKNVINSGGQMNYDVRRCEERRIPIIT